MGSDVEREGCFRLSYLPLLFGCDLCESRFPFVLDFYLVY